MPELTLMDQMKQALGAAFDPAARYQISRHREELRLNAMGAVLVGEIPDHGSKEHGNTLMIWKLPPAPALSKPSPQKATTHV